MRNKHDYVVDVLQHTVLNLVNISIYSSSISSLHVFGAVSSPPTFLNLKEGGVVILGATGRYVTLKIIRNLHNGDPGFRNHVTV